MENMNDLEKVIEGQKQVILHMHIMSEVCYDGDVPYYEDLRDKAEDALESLKEQEPRVMTKEEIIGWDGYIWFEFSGMRAMKVVLIDHGMVREPFRGDYPTKELSWETCQKTWRAWTNKPTDEQRQAVKWDG